MLLREGEELPREEVCRGLRQISREGDDSRDQCTPSAKEEISMQKLYRAGIISIISLSGRCRHDKDSCAQLRR